METIKAKMKSLTTSIDGETTILKYVGNECILINNHDRKFVFDSTDGKMFVFIKTEEEKKIREVFNDTEVEISFFKESKGNLIISKKIGSKKMNAKFDIEYDTFKVEKDIIHVKYKIIDGISSSYLSKVEIFMEIGGNNVNN